MDEQESFDSAQDNQQDTGSNEGQGVNQVAPTPQSSPPSYNKLIISIVVAFVLVVVGLILYLGWQEWKIQKIILPKTVTIYDDVPKTYEECIRTDKKYISQFAMDRSELECSWSVFGDRSIRLQEEVEVIDNEKFKECLLLGGRTLTYVGDCTLSFYNPNYIFPKSHTECVNENKGEPISTKECLVSIELFNAHDKDVTNRLIERCRDLGGNYSESKEYPEFKDCTILFKGTISD